MTKTAEPAPLDGAAPPATGWLVLVHQLPATPSNLRVRVWRRMQQIGAIALKQAVWVLPDRPATREDFEWLRTEIEGFRGHATVLTAHTLDAWTHDRLVDEFRSARDAAYRDLLQDVTRTASQSRRRRSPGGNTDRRVTHAFRDRLAAIDRIDFFGSARRDAVVTAIQHLEPVKTHAAAPAPRGTRGKTVPAANSGRLWVTRPRPGVDRMASAWLIRRFVDPAATFAFVVDRLAAPQDSVPFDMFGVEFTHRGDRCTFEVLCDVFQLHGGANAAIAEIVHDLDLKDGRFGSTAAPTVGAVIEGLQMAQPDDHALLDDGMRLFEGLYLSFDRRERSASPSRDRRKASQRDTRHRRNTRDTRWK